MTQSIITLNGRCHWLLNKPISKYLSSLNIVAHVNRQIMTESCMAHCKITYYLTVVNLLLLFTNLIMKTCRELKYTMVVKQDQICALRCNCGMRFHLLLMYSAYRLENSLPLVCPLHETEHDFSDSPIFRKMVLLYHERMYKKDVNPNLTFTIDVNDIVKSPK